MMKMKCWEVDLSMKSFNYSNIFDKLNLEKLEEKFPDLNDKIKTLSEIQTHKYLNKKIAAAALTHRSALVYWQKNRADIICNEKLEYLGDSFLNFFVASYSMSLLPDLSEGELSKLRACLVDAENLAQKSRSLNLGSCLLFGNGHKTTIYNHQNNILADAFESITAALLLDAGFEKTSQWLTSILHNDVISTSKNLKNSDAKGALQHLTQTKFGVVPKYTATDITSNKLEPLFDVAVFINDRELARTTANTKKAGSKKVAEEALKILESEIV